MDRRAFGPGVISMAMMLAACVSSPPKTESDARAGTDVITRAEIERGQWSDTYHLVRALRPRWLESRGADTIVGQPGEVQVYVDGMRLGGIDLLRTIPTSAINHLEWVDPVSAAGRWGPGHGHGVIAIFYRPEGTP